MRSALEYPQLAFWVDTSSMLFQYSMCSQYRISQTQYRERAITFKSIDDKTCYLPPQNIGPAALPSHNRNTIYPQDIRVLRLNF